MSQSYLHRLTGAKRSWLPDPDPDDAELTAKRQRNDVRHHSVWNSIIDKYSKDFTGIGDEVDLRTNEIIVNNGHIARIEDELDNGNDSSPPRARGFLHGVEGLEHGWEEYVSLDEGSEDTYSDYDDDEVDELNSDWPAQTPQRRKEQCPAPRKESDSPSRGSVESDAKSIQQSAPKPSDGAEAEVAASVEIHDEPAKQTQAPQPPQQPSADVPNQLQAAMQAMTTVMSSAIQAQMMAFMNMMLAHPNLATAPTTPAFDAARIQNMMQPQALMPAISNSISDRRQETVHGRGQDSLRKSALSRSHRTGASRGPGRGVTPGAGSLWVPSDSDSRPTQSARAKARHSRQRDSISTYSPEPRSVNLNGPHKSAQQPRVASVPKTHTSRNSIRTSSSPMASVFHSNRSPGRPRLIRTQALVIEDSEDDFAVETQPVSSRKKQPIVVVPAYAPLQSRRNESEIMAEKTMARGKKRQALPDTATAILEKHHVLVGDHPSSTVLEAIAKEACLTYLQTKNWFARTRRRDRADLGSDSKASNRQMSSTDVDTDRDAQHETPMQRHGGRLRTRHSKINYNAKEVFMGMFDEDSDVDWQPSPQSARIKRPRSEMTKTPSLPTTGSRTMANGVPEPAQTTPAHLEVLRDTSRTANAASASIQEQQTSSFYDYDWALPTRPLSPGTSGSHKVTPKTGGNARHASSARSTTTSQSPLRQHLPGSSTNDGREMSPLRARPNILSGIGARLPVDDGNRRSTGSCEIIERTEYGHRFHHAGKPSASPASQAIASQTRRVEGPAELQSILSRNRDNEETGHAAPALTEDLPRGKSAIPHLCPNCKATSSVKWLPNPFGGRFRFCHACYVYYRKNHRLRDPAKEHVVRRARNIERGACDHCAEQMLRKVKPDGNGKRYCQTCRKYAKEFGGRLPMDFIRKPKPKCERCKTEVKYILPLSNDINVCQACHDDIFHAEPTLDGRRASEPPVPQSSGDDGEKVSTVMTLPLSPRLRASEASKLKSQSDLSTENKEGQSHNLPRTSIRELVTSAEEGST